MSNPPNTKRQRRDSTSTDLAIAIKQAINTNNEGARLLHQCHYDLAAKSFTSVLRILKSLVSIVEDKPTTRSVPWTISYIANKLVDGDNDNVLMKTKRFVCLDPVVIQPEDDDPSFYYSFDLLSRFLMIVMYNFALTLHLHALSLASLVSLASLASLSSSNQTKYEQIKKLFMGSKKLYELACKMHREMHLGNSDADDILFNLVLTNNLGLVNLVLSEKVQSKICFQNMFSTMMC